MPSLVLGDLEFEVRRSSRRRSLEIIVDRDGSLLLVAPTSAKRPELEQFVQRKRFWIYTKLAEKDALPPAPARKQYVSGEGFPYLGRKYRLQLVSQLDAPVKLEAGRFKMRRSEAVRGRELLVRWYAEHAQPWISQRVERYAGRLGVKAERVTVQELGYRWGSCGKGGRLYFHWKSILLPPRIVEYVVVHELTHLLEPHHTPSFWQRVERSMPDFELRKQWLAEHGAETSEL